MTTAYPLTWPANMPRSKAREKGPFKTTLAGAIANVKNELALFGKDSGKALSGVVISSNVSLGEHRPADPGVAVWFTWDGMQVCIPVDRYQTVEANLQAIYHVLAARRTELRHGTLALVRATFTGFLALPAPADGHWTIVLGVSATVSREDLDEAFRLKAKKAHPDNGGSADAMAIVNAARAAALKDRGFA